MRYTRILLLALGLFLLPPADAFATRGKLLADCIIQLKGTTGGQTRVTVMPGTSPAYVLTPTNLRFVLELVLDETYLLTFEHPECVTKQLYVDTTVPIELRTRDFDFPLRVLLQHHKEPFVYAGPVGFIFYQHSITDFSYSTDYTVVIHKRFAERMAELERTGVDPRTAIVGYTATTTPPKLAPAEADTASSPFGSMLAPTVAHVAPMVHRLTRPDTLLRRLLDAPVPTAVAMPPAPVIAALPTRSLEPIAAAAVPLAEAPVLRPVIAPAKQAFTWELVVEERRITTIIRITEQGAHTTEYRRVLHSSGAAYFFQDGRSITERNYLQDTHGAWDKAMAVDPAPCVIQ